MTLEEFLTSLTQIIFLAIAGSALLSWPNDQKEPKASGLELKTLEMEISR